MFGCQKHTYSEERPYKGRQGSRYSTRKTQQVRILQSKDDLMITLCSVITRSTILKFGSYYPKNLLNNHSNSNLFWKETLISLL